MRTTDRSSCRRPFRRAASALAALLACGLTALGAQTDDPMLFCMGTSVRLAEKDWAYVLWDVTEGAAFPDVALAVYARAGGFADGGTFSRAMIAQRQTDPAAVAWVIDRAEAIGQTAADLSNLIDSVFSELALASDLTLAQRLAAVVRAAESNEEIAGNLRFLARRHAAIAMALGRATIVPIASSGATTIELRAFDPASGTDGALRGRVAVTANTPRVMPAPINLADASDASPKGDLAIGMRWNLSDDYRRVSLLGFGFNVYRIDRAFAEAHGYHIAPPTRTALPALLAANPQHVRRANRLPILIDEDETPPTAPFFVDDNGRFETGGAPFADGDQYYYFVTACDVLGRDGDLSSGVLLTARSRFAPLVPIGIQARRLRTFDGAARDFGIEVSWKTNPETSNDVTSAYYVYRYTNQTDAAFRSTNASFNRIGGPILQNTNVTRIAFVDTGVGEADIGRYRYYTVRAVRWASASTNWSGHSAPVACNLRDEDGPSRPDATLYIDSLAVGLTADPLVVTVDESPFDNADFRLVCKLKDAVIRDAADIVEFRGQPSVSNTAPPALIGRYHPGEGQTAVTSDCIRAGQKEPWTFWCQVTLKNGLQSSTAISNSRTAEADLTKYNIVFFSATGLVSRVPSDGGPHYTPGDGPQSTLIPTNGPPTVTVTLDHDACEWRLYTQIDDGPLTLCRQGLGQPDTVVSNLMSDVAQYLHCSLVSYFVQTFDNNGNPSPLTRVGQCYISGAQPETIEYVSVEPTGTVTNPALDIIWVASPYAVDHFNLYAGLIGEQPPAVWVGSILSSNLADGLILERTRGSEVERLQVGRYETPRVGPAFGDPDSNLFTVRIPVVANKRYRFQLTASSRCQEGPRSEWVEAAWTTPAPPQSDSLPWPARPLPEVINQADSDIRPVFIPALGYDDEVRRNVAGVTIGRVVGNSGQTHTVSQGYLLPTQEDLPAFLYTLGEGTDPLPPFVIYRRQIANALFPHVSGQYVQASPLIEAFATAYDTKYQRQRVFDPYIVIGPIPGVETRFHSICIRDRLGIVGGATYEYCLMRFDARREPRDVLKLGTVTIPTRTDK